MRNIFLIHGVNLNVLGKRDPAHYGCLTLDDIEAITKQEAESHGFGVISYQSNHEGAIVDQLQMVAPDSAGIIINPGAFTHYSYALYDALLDTKLPVIEVHLSDIKQRESWRQQSVTAPAAIKMIAGKNEEGYREAVNVLVEYLNHVGND